MLTASMVGQMAGALAAIFLSQYGRAGTRLIAMTMVLLVVVGVMFSIQTSGITGWILVVSVGVIWMITTPALTGLVLEADPTRRSVPFAATAQLLGAATLPTLIGLVFASDGMDSIVLVSAICIAASLLLVVAALRLACPIHKRAK
ncbi:MAG: hypothetical protein ABJP34_00015 [Erythrobacter sp.]